jgi:L-asparaginase II
MTVVAAQKSVEAPILVEVVRGEMVESRHRAIVAVVDAHGRVAAAWGDIARPIYGRSAIKPLLAIPLVETGAADRFKVSDAEVALATASHNGEVAHVEAVAAWLHASASQSTTWNAGPRRPATNPATVRLS